MMSETWRGQKLGEFSKIRMTEGVRDVSRQDAFGTLTPNILFPLHAAAGNSFRNFIYFWDSVRKKVSIEHLNFDIKSSNMSSDGDI